MIQDRRKKHCSQKCELTHCPCYQLAKGNPGISNNHTDSFKNREGHFNEFYHLIFVFPGKKRPSLSSHTAVLKDHTG